MARMFANPNPAVGDIKQKGVTTYALSANRQRPLAGTLNAAVFNSARRFSAQVLYVVPPLLLAYSAMNWAIERYGFLLHLDLSVHGG